MFFFINDILPNFFFILDYYLLFRKEIYFFECLYFSEYDIQMSWYVFWLKKGSLIKYARTYWGNGRLSKIRTAAYRGRGCHTLYVHTYLHYRFSCFWHHFCFIMSCFICRNLTLLLFKICFCQKRLFFSNEINLCRHETSFFHLKLFLLSNLAKRLLILIK